MATTNQVPSLIGFSGDVLFEISSVTSVYQAAFLRDGWAYILLVVRIWFWTLSDVSFWWVAENLNGGLSIIQLASLMWV